MEATRYSERFYNIAARHHNPEHHDLEIRRREKLKSRDSSVGDSITTFVSISPKSEQFWNPSSLVTNVYTGNFRLG
jgi:hypothetical protein